MEALKLLIFLIIAKLKAKMKVEQKIINKEINISTVDSMLKLIPQLANNLRCRTVSTKLPSFISLYSNAMFCTMRNSVRYNGNKNFSNGFTRNKRFNNRGYDQYERRERDHEEEIVESRLDESELIFENFVQNQKTIETLTRKGLKHFFDIQARTFEHISNGEDLIACDRTGSGKTIAFCLPILQKYRKNGEFQKQNRGIKFVIMAPTRELAQQISAQLISLKNHPREFFVHTLYGGSPKEEQRKALRSTPTDILVATPGRLLDIYNMGDLDFRQVETLCLDEADYMLDLGFKQDIQNILEIISNQRKQNPQMLLFSATIPQWIKQISKKYMKNNRKIVKMFTDNEKRTSTTIKHYLLHSHPRDRLHSIGHLIKNYSKDGRVLIFTNTKADANFLSTDLAMDNHVLHSEFQQKQREKRLSDFKKGHVKVLIATDVAARGLDIPSVELVIQINPPNRSQSYIHRSGRTGRAGNQGICCTIVSQGQNEHKFNINKIMKDINAEFEHIKLEQKQLQQAEILFESMKNEKKKRIQEEKRKQNQQFDGYNLFIPFKQSLTLKELLQTINQQTSSRLQSRDIKFFAAGPNKPGKAFIFLRNEEDMLKITQKRIYTNNNKRIPIFRKKSTNNNNRNSQF